MAAGRIWVFRSPAADYAKMRHKVFYDYQNKLE